METIQNIFINTLKEKKAHEDTNAFVKDIVFELSRKKLSRLKDPKSIEARISELFTLFLGALKEHSMDSNEAIEGVIAGLVSAVSFDDEFRLYEKIYEKERLIREIRVQKESIYQNIGKTFELIGTLAGGDKMVETALNDVKLRGIEMLGILKETTEEALLRTIERGSDIEETANIITKNIAYQAIDGGDFRRDRFLQIAKSVLEVAIDISESDHAHARPILRGSVHGTRDGISKAVEVFKNKLQFAPEETEIMYDLLKTKKELGDVEEEFIELLREFVATNRGISAKIIDEVLEKELDSSFAKLQRLTSEAREAINIRLEDLKENASHMEKELKEKASSKMENLKESVEEFRQSAQGKKVQEDAKNLGDRAWEVAKEFIKSAKEAMNKK